MRRILEADLWEISIVTFPMLPSARVSNVKNARFFRDKGNGARAHHAAGGPDGASSETRTCQ